MANTAYQCGGRNQLNFKCQLLRCDPNGPTENGFHGEVNAGWGPSGGAALDASSESLSGTTPIPGLDLGLGGGAMVAGGAATTTTIATPPNSIGNIFNAIQAMLNWSLDDLDDSD